MAAFSAEIETLLDRFDNENASAAQNGKSGLTFSQFLQVRSAQLSVDALPL